MAMTIVVAMPNSLCGPISFPSTRFEFCFFRGRNFLSLRPSRNSLFKQVDLRRKRWMPFTIRAQALAESSDGSAQALPSSDLTSMQVAAGSDGDLFKKSEEEVSKSGDSLEGGTGRRRALILSLSVPGALAMDVVSLGGCPSARALIQTGTERNEQRKAGIAIDNLKKRVSTFTLDNGMKWVVLERHNAPVISCHTYANVGAANETAGMTGLAHLLEHLAFKGTRLVGTRDPDKEAALLDQLDDVFYDIQEAKKEGRTGDAQQLNKKLSCRRRQTSLHCQTSTVP